MKKVAVTGYKGFLGNYVIQRFVKAGYEVVGIDLPECDIVTDNFSIFDGVEGVVHLAAMKGIQQCDDDPIGSVKVNVLGTCRLLQACHEKKLRFLYISTWEVESDKKKMYDITKMSGEEIVRHYIKLKGLNASILRCATFYGPGMASAGAINQFIKAKNENRPAVVFGDGMEIRQFTHADDIADAVFLCFTKGESRLEPYVVSAKEVSQIVELAKYICGEVIFKPVSRDPEIYKILVSTDMEKLGWEQKISLKEGIRKMIAK